MTDTDNNTRADDPDGQCSSRQPTFQPKGRKTVPASSSISGAKKNRLPSVNRACQERVSGNTRQSEPSDGSLRPNREYSRSPERTARRHSRRDEKTCDATKSTVRQKRAPVDSRQTKPAGRSVRPWLEYTGPPRRTVRRCSVCNGTYYATEPTVRQKRGRADDCQEEPDDRPQHEHAAKAPKRTVHRCDRCDDTHDEPKPTVRPIRVSVGNRQAKPAQPRRKSTSSPKRTVRWCSVCYGTFNATEPTIRQKRGQVDYCQEEPDDRSFRHESKKARKRSVRGCSRFDDMDEATEPQRRDAVDSHQTRLAIRTTQPRPKSPGSPKRPVRWCGDCDTMYDPTEPNAHRQRGRTNEGPCTTRENCGRPRRTRQTRPRRTIHESATIDYDANAGTVTLRRYAEIETDASSMPGPTRRTSSGRRPTGVPPPNSVDYAPAADDDESLRSEGPDDSLVPSSTPTCRPSRRRDAVERRKRR